MDTQHGNGYSLWVVLFALAGAMAIVAFYMFDVSLALAGALLAGAAVFGVIGALLCRREFRHHI